MFKDGVVHAVTWATDRYGYTTVTLPSGAEFDSSDYEDRLDFLYSPSDDGHILYNTCVLLSPTETPIAMPTEAELKADLQQALMPVFSSVVAGETDPDDLTFARNLFSLPACLYRAVVWHGSVDAARAAIIKDVFQL